MLTKLIKLVFIAMVFIAPVPALAIDHPSANTTSIATEKLATEANRQVTKAESQSGQTENVALNIAQKEQPASGWILVLALFGFVMLSNRLGL